MSRVIRTPIRKGFVRYPAVDMTTEFVDALEATRAYEANIGVIEVIEEYGGSGTADHCVRR